MLFLGHNFPQTDNPLEQHRSLCLLHFATDHLKHQFVADYLTKSKDHPLQQNRKISLVEAETIDQVISKCREHKISILLLSLSNKQSLPDLLYTIRAASNNLPIVMIAEDYDHSQINFALNAGVQDILVAGEFSANGLARAIQYAYERSQAITTLEQIQQKARRNNGIKNELIFQIAQEVRKTVDLVFSLTEKKHCSSENRDIFNKLREQSFELSTIISSSLDYTQLDGGQSKANPIRFNAQHYISHLLNLLGYRANARCHPTLIDCNGSWPPLVLGDADKIWRITFSLFETLIKLAKPGRSIILSGSYQAHNKSQIRLCLRLSQSEIERSFLDAIFESINQEDFVVVRKYGTTGLNLGIAAALTKIIGGRLWFECKLKKGLVFYLEVPVQT